MFPQESVMEIQETIDIRYEEIEGLKQKLSEDHYMNPEQEDELEELIAQAIKFGELCAKRDAKAQAVPEGFETAIQPPEEGQKVIISGIYGVGIAEFSYLYKDEFVMYDMGASNPILSKDQVKFWQPLPDAPQEPAND